MGRILTAFALCLLGFGPAGLEGRGAARPLDSAPVDAAAGTFSLSMGVVGGSMVGQISTSFNGHGDAVCFLPGTFDLSIDGDDAGELRPSSYCGSDAHLRIDAIADVKAGEEVSRPMTLSWTDMLGRSYVLRFDGGRESPVHRARVICLGAGPAGCRSAVVDSTETTLAAEDGLAADTGPHARLFVGVDARSSSLRDLGVYNVPFALVIDSLN